MTATDEMRAAFHKRSATVWTAREIEDAYLAMRALDPEVVELRDDLEMTQVLLRRREAYIDDLEPQLAALRSAVEAAERLLTSTDWAEMDALRAAVRALPPEWRG